MSVQIRDYVEADRPAVKQLFSQFQTFLIDLDSMGRLQREAGYGEAIMSKTLADIRTSGGVFLVAEDLERIVGFVVALILSPIDEVGVIAAKRGRITELYVDTGSRGKSVGRLLVQRAEEYLRSAGCQFIKVEVFAPNQSAHGFYRHLGYRDYDIDMIRRFFAASRFVLVAPPRSKYASTPRWCVRRCASVATIVSGSQSR